MVAVIVTIYGNAYQSETVSGDYLVKSVSFLVYLSQCNTGCHEWSYYE